MTLQNQSKLQFDLQTVHTWMNTTILNSTHAQDGNEIVLIRETPFWKEFETYPSLPTIVLYSIDKEKLQISIMEKQGRVLFEKFEKAVIEIWHAMALLRSDRPGYVNLASIHSIYKPS